MKDQTILELAGMAGIVFLATVAVVVDGELGETLMVAVSAALGAIVAHVYHVTKEVEPDEA